MKKLLVIYYLFPFVRFLILFSLLTLTGTSVNSLKESFLIDFIFTFILTLVFGTFHYFYDTKCGPKKRAKNLSKSPFKELKEHGFREYEDFIWGVVNGYTVFISFVWSTIGKPALNIEALFNPKSFGHFLTLQDIEQIRKNNKISTIFSDKKYDWQRNAIGYLLEYNFRPPQYENVLSKALELTETLMKENLKPISKEETQIMLVELKEWIKTNTNALT